MPDIDLIKKEYEDVVNITPLTEYGEHYYSVEFPDETIDVMVQDGSVLPLPETELDDFFKDMRELKDIMTKEQAPWIDFLEIDEETGERYLIELTPADIRRKYEEHYLQLWLQTYQDTFDDSFPMAALSGTPPEEVCQMIQTCIQHNKDVYEMGFLDIDSTY